MSKVLSNLDLSPLDRGDLMMNSSPRSSFSRKICRCVLEQGPLIRPFFYFIFRILVAQTTSWYTTESTTKSHDNWLERSPRVYSRIQRRSHRRRHLVTHRSVVPASFTEGAFDLFGTPIPTRGKWWFLIDLRLDSDEFRGAYVSHDRGIKPLVVPFWVVKCCY